MLARKVLGGLDLCRSDRRNVQDDNGEKGGKGLRKNSAYGRLTKRRSGKFQCVFWIHGHKQGEGGWWEKT